MLLRVILLLGLTAICGATFSNKKAVGFCLYRKCQSSQQCYKYRCYCKDGYDTVKKGRGYVCVKKCPVRKYYNSCPTACPINCDNYYNQPKRCTKNCRPGVNCVCEKGYIEKSSTDFRCVRPKDCPDPCDKCGDNQKCVNRKCVCKEGYKLSGGKCVGLCYDVKCGKYQKCNEKTGKCVGLCYDVECDDDEKCNDRTGKCVGLCYDVKCDKYEKCNEKTGKCVGLCYDVKCGKYQKCNEKTGKCVGLCYGVECDDDEKCNDRTGKCVGLCYNVKCDEYEKCNDKTGKCVGLCYDVKCGRYQTCDEKTGRCKDNCYRGKCGANEVCRRSDGECVCAEGYRRVKGHCVRYCPPPKVLVKGRCIFVYQPPPY